MDKVVTEFGAFMKKKRREKGLTQVEAARLLNISQAAYGRYELGQRDPGLNMIFEIGRVLSFDPGEFFDQYR